MSQNKSVEEVVKELRTWACNYHGEFFKRYSSDSEEKKKLWFTADEVEKIIEHTLQTSQEREREIVEEILRRVDPEIAQTAHGEGLLEDVVNDIKTVAQKYNITLTNPNKD